MCVLLPCVGFHKRLVRLFLCVVVKPLFMIVSNLTVDYLHEQSLEDCKVETEFNTHVFPNRVVRIILVVITVPTHFLR